VRVLQVSNLYPPYWLGGYERIACWAAEGLRTRGMEVDVLTGRGPALDGRPEIHPRLDLDLQEVVSAQLGDGIAFPHGWAEGIRRHVFSGTSFAACRQLIRRRRPGLLSFWNPAFVTFSPLLAARLRGVPAVVHLSDVAANVFRNPHTPAFPPLGLPAARAAVDALLRLARPVRYVVPSRFLKQRVVSREGLPEDRVEVLHWPIAPDVASDAPVPPRRTRARVLFVGALIPEKGPDVLIRAVRSARRRSGDLQLALAGGGPAAYVAELKSLAAGEPIRFLGRLDRPGILRAYAEHDVLAFPSRWDEPFGLVPLEAMAAGLPVVATSTGGTPEVIVHESTGLLVPPDDPEALSSALLRLREQPALAARLAERGSRHAFEAHGFQSFLDRLAALYAEAAGRQWRVA